MSPERLVSWKIIDPKHEVVVLLVKQSRIYAPVCPLGARYLCAVVAQFQTFFPIETEVVEL